MWIYFEFPSGTPRPRVQVEEDLNSSVEDPVYEDAEGVNASPIPGQRY